MGCGRFSRLDGFLGGCFIFGVGVSVSVGVGVGIVGISLLLGVVAVGSLAIGDFLGRRLRRLALLHRGADLIDNGAIQAGWLRIWADTPGEGSDLDADLLLFLLTIILLGERDELLLFLVLLSLSGRHYSVLGWKRIRTGYLDEAIGDVNTARHEREENRGGGWLGKVGREKATCTFGLDWYGVLDYGTEGRGERGHQRVEEGGDEEATKSNMSKHGAT
ncbi:hypothetical protein E5D57_009406 [Metarhizium anisopliae]|nr:hypothetical protein E5D57_009406 [Metarhizium anisopliae]